MISILVYKLHNLHRTSPIENGKLHTADLQ